MHKLHLEFALSNMKLCDYISVERMQPLDERLLIIKRSIFTNKEIITMKVKH